MDFKGRDIISIRDFSKDEILYVLKTAKKIEEGDYSKIMEGKVLATLFFEPSTRTRLSFESAITKLGGQFIGFADPKVSSAAKGETLSDAIKVIQGYADVVAMRHPVEGAARVAAEVSDIPIINGGDGANQHPTQTFLDLYTILKAKGTLENIHIGFMGDLKYGRTVHSLAHALSFFNAKMYFIAPPLLKMPDDHLEELKRSGIKYVETEDFDSVSSKLDILYSTRIQKERFPDPLDYEKVKGVYQLSKSALKGVKDDLKILHPLPRVDELSTDIDDTNYALYFEQSHNGVPARQALLALVTGVLK